MDKKQKKPIGLVLLALILASIPVTLIPTPRTAQASNETGIRVIVLDAGGNPIQWATVSVLLDSTVIASKFSDYIGTALFLSLTPNLYKVSVVYQTLSIGESQANVVLGQITTVTVRLNGYILQPALSASLVSPLNGTTISSFPVTLTAHVTLGPYLVPGANVTFYVNGTVVGSALTDSSSNANINYTPPVNGVYIWNVLAQNTYMYSAWSSTWVFTASSTPTRSNPTVTLTPNSQSGIAGSTLTYTVSIMNNDDSSFGSSTFSLTYSVPSGWTASLSQASITIAPGSTDSSTTLSVTAPSSASVGDYTVSVTATNTGASTYQGTGSAIYSVNEKTYTINFYTNPSNVGSIVFSGTTYTNGQSGGYASGSYPIVANVPSGYTFTGWSTTGGISVSNPSSSSTTATISGSGTLTANFQSSTGNLQVTVKNVNGNFILSATVKLYNSNWNWLNQDRITDSNGNVYWSNLNHGTYYIEVYYNPNIGLALTEFWGSNQVTVPLSGTASFIFTRHAPYISSITFSSSNIALGQSVTTYVTITNPESFAVNCKARLILDRDYSSPYGYDTTSNYQSIPSGGTKTFTFTWTPTQEGTYYRYGVAYSYYNAYIETNQWDWFQAFTVGSEPDFSVFANPNSLSFTRPSSGSTSQTSTITVTSINSFNSPVSLSGSWIGTTPSGITYSFSKNTVIPPTNGQDTSTLTITVSSTASLGTFTLRITGTSGSLSHYVDISITVSLQPTGNLQVLVKSPSGGSVTPETLILYDANWNEKSRVSPSTNIYTFSGLTSGTYNVEAYSYDMWIGDAVNIQVSSGQTTTVTITTLYLRPLTVTVYYSDGATPLFGANVTIYSHDGYYGRDNYRRAYTTGIDGKAYFYIWPTSKPGEYYKAYVYYAGNEIGSNANVQVNKDTGSSITIISSLPFNGKRIPPEQISLIPQETGGSCWAASSIMVLKYYGTYGALPSQIQLARELGWPGEWYYWNGILGIPELIPVIGQWEAAMERLGKLDFDREFPDPITGGLTFEKVMEDINLNRPIMALYVGHVVVILGYIDEPGESSDKVIVYDPWPPNIGEVQTKLWKDITLNPICNAIRTKPQILEGNILTLQEMQHKIYLHVYDSQERHIGMNYDLGTVEIGIPDARYIDLNTTTVIILPFNVTNFRYVVDAKYAKDSTENYTIIVTSLRQGALASEKTKSGVIKQGESEEYTVLISSDGKSIEIKSLALPWWEYYNLWLILGVTCIIIISTTIFLVVRKRQRTSYKEGLKKIISYPF